MAESAQSSSVSPVLSSPGWGGGGSQTGQPTLMQIMDTIKSCHAALSSQVDAIRVDFAILKDDVQKVRQRVTQAEQRIGIGGRCA